MHKELYKKSTTLKKHINLVQTAMSDDRLLFYHEDEDDPADTKAPWEILVVDDDKSIHQVTALTLKDARFNGRGVKFLHCYSGAEAIQAMSGVNDIALIFLDVVMESETAGLEVVKYIRENLHNLKVRIILRTGQPGRAPEANIISDYDINDYQTKTELTNAKLHTIVISALRSYQEIDKSESLNVALGKMLASAKILLTATNHEELYTSLCTHTLNILPLYQKYEPLPVIVTLLEICFDTYTLTQKHSCSRALSDEQIHQYIQLAKRTHQENKSIIENKYALLYIAASDKNTYQFLALKYSNPIEAEESKLLLNLAFDVEIACNNVYLRESLEINNEQLEKKVRKRTKELEVFSQKAEQANQEKSRFLSNMSHEIRTPMNAILGFTQILKRSYEYPKEQQSMLDKIDQSGQHLLEIVNDVLDISKIEAGAMTLNLVDFDLTKLIFDMGNIFNFRCEQKHIDWSVKHDLGPSLLLHGDQGKLRQVLNNLLGNALKFTDSGSIELSVSRLANNQYRFAVKDTGPGISEEEIKGIFENFTQGKAGIEKGGTGLGLSISSNQIKLMGGALELDKNINKGSILHFTIMIEPCASGIILEKEYSVEKLVLTTHSPFKALCVDDVASNREIIGNILMSAGINVMYACDGQEAISLLRKEYFDIVYMDLMMPVMRGDEAIKLIRNDLQLKDLTCIAVSAFSLSHEIQHYLSIGFDLFIAKPFRVSDIFKSLLKFFPDKFSKPEDPELNTQSNTGRHEKVCLSSFKLPDHYLNRLKSAAAINRSSQVKKLLLEVSVTQPQDTLYIDYLSGFIEDLDMDGLINALEEIENEQ